MSSDKLIEIFYTAFAAKDYTTMKSCYHEQIKFEDPVFGKLQGADVSKMWEMLLTRSNDLSLTFSDVRTENTTASARWIAQYTFSATGRKITNIINASFIIKDGKIINHTDSFDLNAWFKMAFGLKGYLFILLPFLKRKFQKRVRNTLMLFISKNNTTSAKYN